MRIKRFNENQQYLTEPYDPEFQILDSYDFSDHIKKFEAQLNVLVSNLGLKLNISINRTDGSSVYRITDGKITSASYSWKINKTENICKLELDSSMSSKKYNTIEDIKQDLIRYFDNGTEVSKKRWRKV